MKFVMKFILLFLTTFSLYCEEGHLCSFPKISLVELLRYAGKSAKVNFIADEKILDFDVVFISQNNRSSKDLLDDLFKLLNEYDLEAIKDGDSYIIRKITTEEKAIKDAPSANAFNVFKLRYHSGEEILPLLKESSFALNDLILEDALLKKAISTLQWVKTSNTLFYSSNEKTRVRMKNLIEKLDVPLKQVYVEVLVLETDINKGNEFGVAWRNAPSSDILSACKDSLAGGMNMDIIGNAIVNGKKVFNELASFVRYIDTDTKTSIVLNQKILARENKLSTIFEGDNVPFAGSIIELSGTNERRTANIEYKDIGVSLNITPMISDTGIITLTIDEQITESHNHLIDTTTNLSGIKTSKTQMTTEAHVPNDHFLILSGMTRKVKILKKTGPPILRSIPIIKSLFTSEKAVELKKSLVIFVRPHVVENL
ncbi:MAG: Type 3 secretion system secretin [Chlamydiia bacterium]|nr:Type 3 secretion system secretin [Chlamydiia bacterium]